MQGELVGDLADHPEPVPVLTGPGGATLGIGPGASVCGPRCAAVGHLAVQRAVVFADKQPPVTGTVANGVGG